MKVLIVNTSDISGGAARATYRLHRSLLTEGIDSLMLVQDKKSDDYTVLGPGTKLEKVISKIRPVLDQMPLKVYKHRIKTPFSPAWLPFSNVVKKVNNIDPDIVHLHWIAGGMLRIEDLEKIRKPIIWTLHDNWALTGGCHIKWDCENYFEKCGKCPLLKSSKEFDLSRLGSLRKERVYSKLKQLYIVSPSNWLADLVSKSSLLKDKYVKVLPNPIFTEIFKPIDKEFARKILNLLKDKKLILFSAINAINDINKGFSQLVNALQNLKLKNIEIVILGSSKPKEVQNFGFPAHYLGHLYDDISLVILYNASDVTVVPSLQENLSNTIMESLSCGTPAVAFDIGGNGDMVEHKRNGYLAKPFDPLDLANGIEWVLSAPNYDEICQNAREKVLKEFDSRVVAKKYIELYKEVLNKK
jgi:glycosyltransferase involved in cell wall biosynthesis